MQQASTNANAFANAAAWLQGTLLGSMAMTVAVFSVASVGLLLLSGRVDMRRGAQVVLGCFILFGAPTLAVGIMSMMDASPAKPAVLTQTLEPNPVAPHRLPGKRTADPFDPYAGAALPTDR